MTNEELIARQAKVIAELTIRMSELESMIERARGQMYCIGGPLNDNKRGYNKEQLFEWFSVAERLR